MQADRNAAIDRANRRAERSGKPFVVVARTAHPRHPGQTVFIPVREAELHTLSADASVIHTTDPYSRWGTAV